MLPPPALFRMMPFEGQINFFKRNSKENLTSCWLSNGCLTSSQDGDSAPELKVGEFEPRDPPGGGVLIRGKGEACSIILGR